MSGARRLPGIQPRYSLYGMHVGASTMDSPPEPAVVLFSKDLLDGCLLGGVDVVTPAQAREYARRILVAADEAEGVSGPSDADFRLAVEAVARAYYGCQSIEHPGSEDLRARFRASWDEGRVKPEIMSRCRAIVLPLVEALWGVKEKNGR